MADKEGSIEARKQRGGIGKEIMKKGGIAITRGVGYHGDGASVTKGG